MGEMMRTHVLLPRELIEQIDHEVGPRRRSAFVAEALREKLEREEERRELLQAMDAAIGSLADVDVPGWETAESARAWVRAQRRGANVFDTELAIGR